MMKNYTSERYMQLIVGYTTACDDGFPLGLHIDMVYRSNYSVIGMHDEVFIVCSGRGKVTKGNSGQTLQFLVYLEL